jgi:hypothetical protein
VRVVIDEYATYIKATVGFEELGDYAGACHRAALCADPSG